MMPSEENQAGALQTIRKFCRDGDIPAAIAIARKLDDADKNSGEFQKLLTQMMVSLGRYDQAIQVIFSYVERFPDDNEGWDLARRVSMIYDEVGLNRKFRELEALESERQAARIEEVKKRLPADLSTVSFELIKDKETGAGLRSLVLNQFLQISDEHQKTEIKKKILENLENMNESDQIYFLSILLYKFKENDKFFEAIKQKIETNEIPIYDFPALFFTLNFTIGKGNMEAFEIRHALFDALSRSWAENLQKLIDFEKILGRSSSEKSHEGPLKIAIIASPIINMTHAPSNRAVEIASSLQARFNHRTRIFECGHFSIRHDAPTPFFMGYNARYVQLSKRQLMTDQTSITKIPFFLDDSQYLKFKQAVEEIVSYNPDTVLFIGDASPLQHILKGRVPTVVYPTNSSVPVGPADRYLSHWTDKQLQARVDHGDWPKDVAEKSVTGAAAVRLPTANERLPRSALAPTAELFLCLVGRRIDDEIRGEFADRIADVLSRHNGVHLVCFGSQNKTALLGSELAAFEDRLDFCNIVDDLVTHLTAVDIFINPLRQGGGTGVALAMSVGCPVVCFDHGDGATLLEPQELCSDMDEYFARVEALIASEELRRETGARMIDQVEHAIGFESGMVKLEETLRSLRGLYATAQ